MILTRRTVTASSMLMLPTYLAIDLIYGLALLLSSPSRYVSPAYDAARDVLPLRVWGVVFLILAAVMAVAIILKRRRVMMLALCLGVGIWACWGTLFLAALFDGTVSDIHLRSDIPLTTPVPWIVYMIAHIASLRSLTYDSRVR